MKVEYRTELLYQPQGINGKQILQLAVRYKIDKQTDYRMLDTYIFAIREKRIAIDNKTTEEKFQEEVMQLRDKLSTQEGADEVIGNLTKDITNAIKREIRHNFKENADKHNLDNALKNIRLSFNTMSAGQFEFEVEED